MSGAVLDRFQGMTVTPAKAWTVTGAEMRQAGSHELFRYWDELRQGRSAPERNDLDPVAIRNVLADTFMLEVDPERTYPFCLSGTRLSALFDAELKGWSFLSLWSPSQRQDVASMLQIVVDGICPVIAGAAAAPADYDTTEFELLLLPLRYYGKTHARALGRIAPAKRPSWLGLIPIQNLEFLSMRVLDGTDIPAATAMPAASKTKPESNPSFSAFEQRGHLRVYPGNP